MTREVIFFLAMTACGGASALLLDIIRAARLALKPNAAAVAVSDVIFCLGAMLMAMGCVWNLNSGAFRVYELIAMLLGAVLYFSTVSRWILRFFTLVFENILKLSKIIFKILLTPLSFLYKILIVPVWEKIRKGKGTQNERIHGKNN